MATKIVSLFLPYTVDFHDSTTSPVRQQTVPPPNDSISEVPSTLFSSSEDPRTPPNTAAETRDPFAQVQPSAATHFLNAHNPRTLLRSDAHVPEWGQDTFFNQPKLRGAALPPDTILQYVQAVRKARDAREKQGGGSTLQPRSSARHHKRMGSNRFPPTPVRSRNHSVAPPGDDEQAYDWTIEPAIQGNGGLYNAVRAATDSGITQRVSWVGTVGFPTDSLDASVKADISERLKTEFNAQTVYPGDGDLDGHYTHYCKTILWPVFHYQIPDHPKSKAYEDHSFNYYVNLNQNFADTIVASHEEGDTIWINDYHLLLVPEMIRKKIPNARIGFFLHTAFPSSEVFRCLATRQQLLYGMLGADLIAFQSAEYSYHFLSTCKRVLPGMNVTNEGVHVRDRVVNVAAIPIGVDPKGLEIARAEPEVMEWIKTIQQRYKGKKLIVARDQLDHVRGVRQKLLAFELFLNKYPEWREKVVLIQVATSTAEHSELATTVSDIQTRIDTDHSTLAHQPLVLLRQDIAFSQYLALLSVADALLVTSLRDGMNLTTHEFVLCQDGRYTNKKWGPIILSEFTGSASVLGPQVLSINPWDYQKVADAINIALNMQETEKERRHQRLKDVVVHQNGEAWTQSLFSRLAKRADA